MKRAFGLFVLVALMLPGLVLAQTAPAPASPLATIFAAVDLSTVVAFVAATGVIIIGICMAFKGVDLGKRGVRKV
jgi:hypothetical protein